jgi:hypothetical protein
LSAFIASPSSAIFLASPFQPARQHAGGKGIAAAHAVDDVGDLDLGGLVAILAQVHAGGEAVVGLRQRVARGGGHHCQVGKGGKGCLHRLAPAFRAIARKGLCSSSAMSRWLPKRMVASPAGR